MSEKIESEKVNLLWMEDGREAERRTKVSEAIDDCCNRVTVEELYVEQKPPKFLSKRITEEECPVVCKRIVEDIDETGEIVERKVEELDTGVRLVDHIKKQPQFKKGEKREEDRIDRLTNVVENLALTIQEQQDQGVDVATLSHSKSRQFVRPMQETAQKRVQSSKSISILNLALAVVITAQVAALVYIAFWM